MLKNLFTISNFRVKYRVKEDLEGMLLRRGQKSRSLDGLLSIAPGLWLFVLISERRVLRAASGAGAVIRPAH